MRPASLALGVALYVVGVRDAAALPMEPVQGELSTFDRTATFDEILSADHRRDAPTFPQVDLDGYTEGGLVISYPSLSGSFYPPCPTFVPSDCGTGFSGGFFHPNGPGPSDFVTIRTADGLKMAELSMVLGSFIINDTHVHVRWETVDNGVSVGSGVFSAQRGTAMRFSDLSGFDELHLAGFVSLAAAETGFEGNPDAQSIAIDRVRATVQVVPEPHTILLLATALTALAWRVRRG